MLAMDQSIMKLYREGVIDRNVALGHSINKEMMERSLR